MTTSQCEAHRVQALLRAEDRELAQALIQAQARTRRNAASVGRSMREGNAAVRIRQALMRPSSSYVAGAIEQATTPVFATDCAEDACTRGGRGGRGVQRPVGNKGGVTFHFGLSRKGSVGTAVAHQCYVERDEACVASFGNFHERYEERCRLWKTFVNAACSAAGA